MTALLEDLASTRHQLEQVQQLYLKLSTSPPPITEPNNSTPETFSPNTSIEANNFVSSPLPPSSPAPLSLETNQIPTVSQSELPTGKSWKLNVIDETGTESQVFFIFFFKIFKIIHQKISSQFNLQKKMKKEKNK